MFLVGRIKGGVIDNGRFDGFLLVGLDLLLVDGQLEFRLDAFGDFLLAFVRTKDDAPVLGTCIVSLPVQCRRIVEAEEKLDHLLKDLVVGRRGLCQLDVQDLDVPGSSAADLAVRGILHPVRVGVHEADLCIGDASGVLLLKVLDNVFLGTPVAACAEGQSRSYWRHILVR